MIKASELRIGNIIGLEDGSPVEASVEAFRSAEFWKDLETTCKPVPLTNEWLLMLGFFESAHSLFSIESLPSWHIRHTGDNFEIIKDGKTVLSKSFSVHRFQNLIFELTDIELRIIIERDELRDAIEMVADGILYQYIPTDRSAQSFSFNLSIEGEYYEVQYRKDSGGYWIFNGYSKNN
ncbi:hypothetical protein BDE36_3955 [Arcticibacter tournemirensis]|uniref:Uncharacterized protein n=1 Tax=Arcticibacter tournemirensis TaxID=699437 RepID=A0A4Q0ME55_9SPHI|nr:hypothetical protein [Arcticibacter tournemirensis]KAA8486337.1 hypothetical protein F1649_01790 [Arcticibacter tournemirensis]RXF71106.1 hypothetical protein EKH83_05250 [Arcticibacter tournemirensis]TQM52153.1 hypothetical protein BDE36_3955 [Arcticibacter tournemirensis]